MRELAGVKYLLFYQREYFLEKDEREQDENVIINIYGNQWKKSVEMKITRFHSEKNKKINTLKQYLRFTEKLKIIRGNRRKA